MAKKKELSEDLRQRLVRAHGEGKAYKAISKQHDVPVATVQSIINKHKRFNTVKKTSVGVAGSVRCPTNLPGKSAERSTTTPEPQPMP